MQPSFNPVFNSLVYSPYSKRGYFPGSGSLTDTQLLAAIDPDQMLLIDSTPHYTTAQWPGFEHLLADRKPTVGTLRTPRAGRCWLFDASNDYATYGGRLTSGSLSAFTITALVKPNSVSGYRVIAGEWSGPSKYGWVLYQSGTNLCFAVSNGSGTDGAGTGLTCTVSSVLSANTVYHLAAVFNAGTPTIYINGSSVSFSQSGSVSSCSPGLAKFDIGVFDRDSLGVGYFGGWMRDIRLYTTAKNATEVASIYNQATTPGTYDTTGLHAAWWCEEEKGTTGYDWSGNGRDLTLTNITQATFHASDTGVTYSDANVRGYRLSGSVYIPATSSTLAADGNALTHTGKCPQPGYAPQKVVTGDGSSVYVDLGSALVPASADFTLDLSYFATGTLTNKGPLTQGNNPGVASRFGLYHLDESTISLLVDHVSGVGTGAVSIAITKDIWSTIRITKSGSSYTLSVNGTSSSITNTGTITQSTNTQILRYSGCVSGRVSNLKVTTGGVTKYFPLCEGPGSSNTNRDVHYIKSDNTSGVVSSAIVNGTVSTIWANSTDYTSCVFNWPLRYGYTVNGSGVIVPAKLDGSTDAAGNAIGQAAGGWASGLQNINCLPYTNPLGVNIGLETSLDPTANRKTTSSSKRRRRNTSGRYDRFGARSTAMSDASSNAYFGD